MYGNGNPRCLVKPYEYLLFRNNSIFVWNLSRKYNMMMQNRAALAMPKTKGRFYGNKPDDKGVKTMIDLIEPFPVSRFPFPVSRFPFPVSRTT